jgi:hypothetical protein
VVTEENYKQIQNNAIWIQRKYFSNSSQNMTIQISTIRYPAGYEPGTS